VLVLAPIIVVVFFSDVVVDVLGCFLAWECKNPEEHLQLKTHFTSGFYMQFIWISFQMLEHQVARVVEDSTSSFGQCPRPLPFIPRECWGLGLGASYEVLWTLNI
jgi:hypothetical protein